ncbi:MAG: hypothetical protein APR54_07210 [Candidatus Cloacimonas sp. SDB]|nr:MAG: hypothetical protein APR54_07210 [Candidatus Cloacimonas sp. SDB]
MYSVIEKNIFNWSKRASYDLPWWTEYDAEIITPYDFPNERINEAKEYIKKNNLTEDFIIKSIQNKSDNDWQYIFKLTKFIQDSILHNPVYQPSDKRVLNPISVIKNKKIFEKRLIKNVLLIIILGEGRCGQVAQVLCELLKKTGFKSKIEKINNHIVTTLFYNNNEYLIDADAYKNNIMFYKSNKLYTKKEILKNPYIVDQFKHTGWMFRRNTRYSMGKNNRNFCGYVDFFDPEIDGQVSYKYGAKNKLLPPSVCIWNKENLKSKINKEINFSFKQQFPERVKEYKIKIGKKSKNYSYNYLIYKNLLNETGDIIDSFSTTTNTFSFKFTEKGKYYITVSAIPDYIDEHPSYLWWSDECKVIIE